jgi:UDP-N-acetylmuramate dehydrogenase
MINKNLSLELAKIIDKNNILIDEPMKNHTSFKVGGPVDILTTPTNFNEVKEIVNFCKDNKTQYYIIGNGSNLLVRDGGIRGIVIKLNKLNNIKLEDGFVIS